MKFDVTLLPDDDTSAWALVAVTLKGPHDETSDAEFDQLYDDWIDYLQEQMRDELQARYLWLSDRQERALIQELSSQYEKGCKKVTI